MVSEISSSLMFSGGSVSKSLEVSRGGMPVSRAV